MSQNLPLTYHGRGKFINDFNLVNIMFLIGRARGRGGTGRRGPLRHDVTPFPLHTEELFSLRCPRVYYLRVSVRYWYLLDTG